MSLRKILCMIAALLPAVLSFAEKAETQREIRIVSGKHAYDLDPHTASYANEAQLLTGLYEGLFSYNPVTLEPVNAICESYKISRDKKRWTFKLKGNVKFSDGTPITASVIKESWLSLLSTKGAPFSSFLDCVKNAALFRDGKTDAASVGINARDDTTLVVNLEEPTGHLASLLCHHSLCAVSKKKGVYSGAFVLESCTDEKIVLKKNENYHEADKVIIPGITITLSDDVNENTFTYNTGNTDWVDSYADSDKIIDKDSVHVSANFGTTYLFFKNTNAPWNNPKIRQALLYAVPYDELRKDYYMKAETLIYQLSGYPKVTGLSDYDADDALNLMNEARDELNIPRDKKLMLVFAGAEPDFTSKWSELLKKAWEPLGVELVVQNAPVERYNASIPYWNADIFFYSWIGDYADPLAFLELFRSNSSFNESGYSNKEYDSLLLQASRSDSAAERMKLLSRAEQLLLDEGEIIPVNHSLSLHVINLDEIGGWSQNALDIHPLRYLYIKKAENPLKGKLLIKY
ncbi:MAG: peptide ABC transporter substrate-binding protein [Treponema sp.]|nr:peptide ABC transporter substrate-binding protein [Treponema sp.]